MLRIFSLRALGAVATLIVLATPAFAQTPSPAPSASPLAQIAHVITADRSDSTLRNTARTIYVVTKADIVQNGYTTVADALAEVPGVSLDRYGAFGAASILSIRGSSSAQVLVLLDGLPVAGSQLGGVDLGQYSTTGISRIEVVEGGGSTLYGAGSVGGIVNIITAKNAKPGALISTGSFDQQTYAFESQYASFSRTYAANDYGLPDGTTRMNGAGALTSGRAGYSHQLGKIEAAFTADLSDEVAGVPGALGAYEDLSTTSRQSTINRDARLTFTDQSSHSTATAQFGDSVNSIGFTCDTAVDSGCPNAYDTPTPSGYDQLLVDQRAMASLRNLVDNGSEHLLYGIDLAHGIARIDPGTGGGPIASYGYAQTGAYVQSQWSSQGGNSFYAGLRGERDGAQGAQLTPSLGGIYNVTPSLYLKANAATAFDAPSAELLYYPGYANPNLQSERLRVGDTTLVAPDLAGGTSLAWFVTSGSNLIESTAASNYIPENVEHAIVEGLTLDTATRPLYGYHATLDVTDLYRAEDLDTDTRLEGRGPVFQARVGFVYQPSAISRFDGFGLSALSKGPQETITYGAPAIDPLFDQEIAYTRIDGYVGFRLAPRVVLTLRGFNLGNERYAEYDGYPLPGRSFEVELRSR